VIPPLTPLIITTAPITGSLVFSSLISPLICWDRTLNEKQESRASKKSLTAILMTAFFIIQTYVFLKYEAISKKFKV
jgi:hypothetical protein